MELHEFTGEPFNRFAICQAYAQLESDYNVRGMLRERPSNARRNESTGCQLSRVKFNQAYGWLDICKPSENDGDDASAVRSIYLTNVLRWNLPIDAEMMTFIKTQFVPEYLAHFPQTANVDYLQGR